MHQYYRMIKWAIYASLLTLLPWLSTAAFGDTYKVALRTTKDRDKTNIYLVMYPRIFEAVSAITDDEFEFITLPPNRVKKYFNEGKIDIEPGTSPIWRASEKVPGLFSIAFSTSNSLMIFGPSKRAVYQQFKGKQDFVIGVVRGYSYPTLDADFTQGWLRRFDESSETRLLENIVSGRLNQIVVSQKYALSWLRSYSNPSMYELGEIIDRQLVMMRVHPQVKSLLPRLNKAMQQLIDSGKMFQLTGVDLRK